MVPTRFRPFESDFPFWPERLDRVFDRALRTWFEEDRLDRCVWYPAVDVSENESEVTIRADLPEVEAKDLNLEIHDGQLTLKGERKSEKEEKKEHYYHVERRFGSFQRTFTLPAGVDTDKVAADYEKGVLTVHVPKSEAAKPKQIKVSAK